MHLSAWVVVVEKTLLAAETLSAFVFALSSQQHVCPRVQVTVVQQATMAVIMGVCCESASPLYWDVWLSVCLGLSGLD